MDSIDWLTRRASEATTEHNVVMDGVDNGGGGLPSLRPKPASTGGAQFARAGRPPFQPRKHVRANAAPPPAAAPPPQGSKLSPTSMSKISSKVLAVNRLSPGARKQSASPSQSMPPPPSVGLTDLPPAEELEFFNYAEQDRAANNHMRQLFSFEQQYSYGLLNFDDATITSSLHVDQEARVQPSLIVQHGIKQLSFRDVRRADLLARLNPPAPEEILAREMELRAFQRKAAEQAASGSLVSSLPPVSKETLVLMQELEKAKVLDPLDSRDRRMESNPRLIKYEGTDLSRFSAADLADAASLGGLLQASSSCGGAGTRSAGQFDPRGGGRSRSPQEIFRKALKNRKMTVAQIAAMRDLLGLEPETLTSTKEKRVGTYLSDTAATFSGRKPKHGKDVSGEDKSGGRVSPSFLRAQAKSGGGKAPGVKGSVRRMQAVAALSPKRSGGGGGGGAMAGLAAGLRRSTCAGGVAAEEARAEEQQEAAARSLERSKSCAVVPSSSSSGGLLASAAPAAPRSRPL